MPLNDQVFCDVYKNSGIQSLTVFDGIVNAAIPPDMPLKSESEELIFLFSWPREFECLQLKVWIEEVESVAGPTGLSKHVAQLRQMAENLFDLRDLKEKFLKPSLRQYLLTKAKGNNKMRVVAVIDTSASSFKEAREKHGVVMPNVDFWVTGAGRSRHGEGTEPVEGHLAFTLRFDPADMEGEFDGVVALDFGNTSSTVVYLSQAGRRRRPEAINHDDYVQGSDTSKLDTVVHIKEIGPLDRLDSTLHPVCTKTDCDVGRMKNQELAKGYLELGAKRRVVSPDNWPALRFTFSLPSGQTESVKFGRQLSAELYIAKLLTKFRTQKKALPRPLVATYPTTYTRAEVARYKLALVKAVRRATGDATLAEEKAVRLLIDEASAACFFFVFNDLVERPGGLYRARLLYPRGLNILIFDVGGGTTDLALLHVEFHPDAEAGAGRVDLKLLGRSGDRDFCGDQMTEQVFRLLKYGLAKLIAAEKLDPEPAEVEGWPDFLTTMDRVVEEAVPTRWNLADGKPKPDVDADSSKIRKKAVAMLWELAEKVKIAVAEEAQKKPSSANAGTNKKDVNRAIEVDAAEKPVEKCLDVATDFYDAVKALFKKTDVVPTQDALKTTFRETISADRLDALIQPLLVRVLEKAKLLMEDLPCRLSKKEHNIEKQCQLPVVHRVYAVGNATRYPVVDKALKEGLSGHVRFSDSRCLFNDERKLVVAQGASRALAAMLQYENITVRFDSNMVDKLPFAVTSFDAAKQQDVGDFLYEEDMRIVDVAAKQHAINIPQPSPEQGPIQKLRLLRRWPGDRVGEAFLRFPFPNGVRGTKVTLFYKVAEQQFVMKNGDTEVIGVPDYDAEYVAPPQSGLL